MKYILIVALGYLLGCSNLAYYISRAKHQDIRSGGSGNLGASNATILLGWKAGIAVALHDIGKAALAVLLAKRLFPGLEYAGAAAGVASVMGHIFPFYLKFKGGKGLASFWGMTAALNWKLGLLAAVVILLATLITDYIVIGTFSTISLVPAYLGITTHNLILTVTVCIASVVIFWKHRENIGRLIRREEIGLRRAIRGDDRLDKT